MGHPRPPFFHSSNFTSHVEISDHSARSCKHVKITSIVLGILFLLFAWVQKNDASQYKTADWGVIGWIALYLFTAVVSFITAWKPLPRAFYWSCATLIILNALYRFTAIQWEKTILYNEENPAGNETGGLLITSIWFTVMAWRMGPKRAEN